MSNKWSIHTNHHTIVFTSAQTTPILPSAAAIPEWAHRVITEPTLITVSLICAADPVVKYRVLTRKFR